MKLTKDTIIEGQIVKEGVEVRIKESDDYKIEYDKGKEESAVREGVALASSDIERLINDGMIVTLGFVNEARPSISYYNIPFKKDFLIDGRGLLVPIGKDRTDRITILWRDLASVSETSNELELLFKNSPTRVFLQLD